MKAITLTSFSPFLSLTAILSFSSASAAVLYTQNFGTGSGAVSVVNWTAVGSQGLGTSQYSDYTNTSPGSASDNANNRLGRHSTSGTDRTVFIRNGDTAGTRNTRYVLTTTSAGSYSLGSDPDTSVGALTWTMGLNNAANMSVKVVVQVAGVWYASAINYTVTNAAGGGSSTVRDNWETKSHDLSDPVIGLGSNAWLPLTFDAVNGITLGDQVAGPIGDTITGIGLFLATDNVGGRVAWIDNVELHSIVPEPSSSLFAAAGLLLAATRRRRVA